MVAMIAACLGDILQFHVGRISKPHPGAVRLNLFSRKIRSDGWNIIGVQGQVAFSADFNQDVIAVNRYRADCRPMVEPHFGNYNSDAAFRIPVFGGYYFRLLNNIVGQQLTGDFLQIGDPRTMSLDTVTLGGIDGFVFCQPVPQQIFHGFNRRGPRIVADPGTIADPNRPVERKGQRFKRRNLRNRICKNFCPDSFKLLGAEICVNGQDMNGTHTL